jgi:uncharacterized membrane protein HdeD (DUF308 family)
VTARHPAFGDLLREMASGGYIEEFEAGTGWVLFAGVMLILVGAINMLAGFAAILNSHYLRRDTLFSNTHLWGWVLLAWGIVQVFVAFGIWGGYGRAAVIGVFSACANIIVQLAWANTNPLWALVAIAADGLVIYGLCVYGGNRNET